MRKSLRIVAAVSLLTLLLSGCGNIKKNARYNKAEKCAESFIEAASEDFVKAINDYSEAEVEQISLNSEQKRIFYNSYEFKGEIKSVMLMESQSVAEVKIEVPYYELGSEFSVTDFNTSEDFISKIKDLETNRKTVKLILKRVDKEWKFEDLKSIYNLVVNPYTALSVCDKEGYPLFMNKDLFDALYVETLWFDPMMASPMGRLKLEDPVAIQCGVYFNEPVTLKFDAVLLDSSHNVIAKETARVQDGIIMICDFTTADAGLQKFEHDNYTIEIRYGDEVFAKTTETLKVVEGES